MAAHASGFACFGGWCSVSVEGTAGRHGTPEEAVAFAREQLLGWHEQFSRFLPTSELSRVNDDPRELVPASPLMVELAAAVRVAGEATGGLVDATLVREIQAAGYENDLASVQRASGPAGRDAEPGWQAARAAAHHRVAAAPNSRRDWARIEVDRTAGTITRPPGVRIDSGGLVKGLLADVLCGWLAGYDDVIVDCCGDARFAGTGGGVRDMEIGHPAGGIAAVLEVSDGAVATSGTTARQWTRPDGTRGHHLLDPSTGQPARTGLVQATALAPTALEAEVRAKHAILLGAEHAARALPHGGLLVGEDGEVRRVAARVVRRA